jgi:hypothetical protein
MKMESQPNDWTIQLTRIEKKFTVQRSDIPNVVTSQGIKTREKIADLRFQHCSANNYRSLMSYVSPILRPAGLGTQTMSAICLGIQIVI